MPAKRTPTAQSDPALGAVVINYGSGDQDITVPVRGIYIGTAGNLKVDMSDGTTVTFASLAAGQVYPFSITKIYQTGSTAAGHVLT